MRRSYVQNVTFLGDGNDFALSVVIALPMCLYLMQSAKSTFARGFWIVAIVVLFGAIMGTQSRGAALGVIAVLMYLWSRARRKAGGLILILGGALIVGVVASDAYLNRLETIAEYQENGSAMGRITAWKSGFQMANERPLNGMGPGCFPIAFGLFYAPPGYPWLTAHSLYFLTLGELGYPGLFLLLALLWVLYRDNQRIIKTIPTEATDAERDYRRLILAISASLVGFVVSGAFLSVLYYPHLYVLAGLIFATQRLKVLDLGPDEGDSIPESRGKEPQGLRRARMLQQRRQRVTAGARGSVSGGRDQRTDPGQQGQKTGTR
jgi:probable O-glycosylation ligase (exosortase A-associated)